MENTFSLIYKIIIKDGKEYENLRKEFERKMYTTEYICI